MFKKILLIVCVASTLTAQSAQDFKNQQMQGFNKDKKQFDIYKKSQEEEFKAYQKEQDKAYKAYKKELGVFWDEPKISTKKKWISYTQDKQTRTDVDFSKETITLETIASSPQEAKEKLQMALAKAVTVDTKTVQETDPLEKKLSKIKKPIGVVSGEVKAEPILSTIIFKKIPTQASVKAYVNKYVKYDKIKAKKSNKVRHANIYSIKVVLPKYTMIKRSKIYYEEVKKNAKLQRLPMALVFAIMHTESNFNPRARSHIPTYGLMQIVPKTAGIDTYKFLYKKKKLVSGSYLYNTSTTIKTGTPYLHIPSSK
jgi:membrane-bound lytic murein transglycosylase C